MAIAAIATTLGHDIKDAALTPSQMGLGEWLFYIGMCR
jgi:hypothetical protein